MSATPLAPFGARTTFRVGGTASVGIEIDGPDELATVLESLDPSAELYVLGRGSNTLVADAGFRGLVLHLGPGFGEVEIDAEASRVRAGAAADLPVVARASVEGGLTGFEWAVGVPGTIGGGVRMNAGGHGSDMAASVVAAQVVDVRTGEITTRPAASLAFSYRSSSIRRHEIVTEVTLQLAPGSIEEGRRHLKEIVQWRRRHQPGGANCGSVFTNPADDSAGRLIDLVGLKGFRYGTAQVSEKHANFIQADAGGSADDVAALIDLVAAAVHKELGVTLNAEVIRVGFEEAIR